MDRHDREDFVTKPVRGLLVSDHVEGNPEKFKLLDWGRLGWQTGRISRLRSETEMRKMDIELDKDYNGYGPVDLPAPRPTLRYEEERDPDGKLDQEAYDRTIMCVLITMISFLERLLC